MMLVCADDGRLLAMCLPRGEGVGMEEVHGICFGGESGIGFRVLRFEGLPIPDS